jgi:hypothetical protein
LGGLAARFKTGQFQVTPVINRALMVKGFGLNRYAVVTFYNC